VRKSKQNTHWLNEFLYSLAAHICVFREWGGKNFDTSCAGISLLYKAPQKVPPSLFSFLSPFSSTVWVYVGETNSKHFGQLCIQYRRIQLIAC
jgi:hypothetical protein